MARTIPVDVREALGMLMEQSRKRREKLTVSEAIDTVRRRFPDLKASDADLIDGITGEAVAYDLAIEFDVPPPNSATGALDRWDNESGAIKKRPTERERREAGRRIVNDTDGTRRRTEAIKHRNQII